LLRVYWVVHNFLRVHLTTREVPAVALGILERRLTVQEIFQMQMGPRSRCRPLSATQHHPTTSLVGIALHCNEPCKFTSSVLTILSPQHIVFPSLINAFLFQ